jgi:3-oxoacyl-[acyl-carrier-protein] synthase II
VDPNSGGDEGVRTREAVWITGVGTANPLGNSYPEMADHLLSGRSGVRPVTKFDVTRHRCKIAAPIQDVAVPPGWEPQAFRRLIPLEQLLLWCTTRALQDAGWWENRDHHRLGLVLGLGAEWVRTWEDDRHLGGNRVREPHRDLESILDIVRRRLGLTGLAANVAAACASGNQALGLARHWIQLGWVGACLAGACTLDVSPMSLAGFANVGALTRRNNNPEGASRPFDRGRDGFVMGDGGAMFVLEPASGARRRGARAYGEVAGFAATSDAFHMVAPSSNLDPAAQAMRVALADAQVRPDELDYVNAHAPSTPIGDRFESQALHLVLGEAIRKVPVSSTKSMTGHLLSAAAAVEAVACLVALERQAVPPTINLDDPDPECELCHVPHQARPQAVRVVLSNSFGFGGCNTCLVLRKAA